MNSVEFFGSLVCFFVLFCFVYFSFGVEADKEQVRKIRHIMQNAVEISQWWSLVSLEKYSQKCSLQISTRS